jgi:GTP cyclohydrolase II
VKRKACPNGALMREPQKTNQVRQIAATELPTRWGIFRALGFERQHPGQRPPETALVLVLGDPSLQAPLVRIHSQCITGEVLRSLRCDCGEQLELAMEAIAGEGCGLLIYEQQEGRGIGLMAKLQAYALQDRGLDTIAANHALGFEADCRDFMLPGAILKHLGIFSIRLLSNNPEKCRALAQAGISVVERIPCEAPPSSYSTGYLGIKKYRMGHTLTLV